MRRWWMGLLSIVAASVAFNAAHADCRVSTVAELPVTMNGTRPLVPAKINGIDVHFLVDSGAFFSMISEASAQELHLHTSPAPFGFYVTGVGGSAEAEVATVKTFTLAKADIPNVQFIVGGAEVGASAIGVLGQNVLSLGDVEYDLANGAVRLFKTQGCARNALAYWAAGKPFSIVPIESVDTDHHTVGQAKVNGVEVRTTFDTGAARSQLSLRAAARAGLTPDSPGAVFAGYSSGIGRRVTKSWIVPVNSFQVGDETVKNTRIRIGDIGESAMLLGADFFLSHRVYVANSQRKLYFTYNGGPVFNLSRTPEAASQSAAAAEPAGEGGQAAAAPEAPTTEPTDADGFSRRGSAFAARHDYEHAIADYGKAIALAPAEPSYLHQRAVARLASHQPFMAMGDLDAELKLKPDDVQARLTRASLRLVGHDQVGAREDVNAAAAAAAKEADVRLQQAELYMDLEQFDPAIAQFDLWIAVHGDDSRLSKAFNGRCRARGLAGRDLDKAMSDCNAAVRLTQHASVPLENRGLVHQRRGEYDQAIADFNAALATQPKNAWALYGRGVCELKTGVKAQGDADLAAAAQIAPRLAERAAKLGFTP